MEHKDLPADGTAARALKCSLMLASGSRDGDLYLWSIGNTLQRQDGQEGHKEELEVEQQPRISEIVSLQFLLLFHHISCG
jgi:hypothetical protein